MEQPKVFHKIVLVIIALFFILGGILYYFGEYLPFSVNIALIVICALLLLAIFFALKKF